MTGDDAEVSSRVASLLSGSVTATERLDGGQVGTVRRVDLADGRTVVAKTADLDLETEARMLDALAEAGLPVPAVLAVEPDLLVLEFVPGGDPITPAVLRNAADHLAALHDASLPDATGGYGFHCDTPSGALKRPNPWTDSWVAFFREHRLTYVADRCRSKGLLPADAHDRVLALAGDLDEHLREPRSPSLVHGDVWRENLRVDGDRVAAFLDPTCYVGHAEVDLAYVDWTDTFGDPFFERYRQRRGIAPGFEARKRVYSVVPILEHVWHFGREFLEELDGALAAIGY